MIDPVRVLWSLEWASLMPPKLSCTWWGKGTGFSQQQHDQALPVCQKRRRGISLTPAACDVSTWNGFGTWPFCLGAQLGVFRADINKQGTGLGSLLPGTRSAGWRVKHPWHFPFSHCCHEDVLACRWPLSSGCPIQKGANHTRIGPKSRNVHRLLRCAKN